jgi:hypothetical protein
MLTRKFFSEEDILKILNEEMGGEEEAEETEKEEGSVSPEDVDLDSLSNEEKINFAKEILQSIEANESAQEKIDEIIDMLSDVEFEDEEDED